MSNFENPLPEWNAGGIEPPQSKKDEGWKEGDKPPAPWHNWWMYTSYKALKEMREYLDELEIVTKWEDIEEKPETFPPSTHTHDIKDVTGLQVKMNKLDGIEEGANKYTHPDTHQASMIVESTDKRFVSDAEKENWNSKETPEGAQEKVNEHANKTDNPHKVTKTDVGLGNVTNTKQASEASLNTHKDDGSAHGIGDKSTLETTEKSTIVGALNELFTNVSDGKKLIGGAITDVDEGVEVPADATFEELASAIGKVETGKKWASGEESSVFYEITGLDFKPNHFFVFSMDTSTGSILVGSEEAKLSNGGSNAMLAQSSANFIRTFNLTFKQGGIEGFSQMHNLSYPIKWYAIE